MKRLKLHRASHLKRFFDECMKVIVKAPTPTTAREIFVEQAHQLNQTPHEYRAIYKHFASSFTLWDALYSVLLPADVKATFEYYRALPYKEYEEAMSRPFKEFK